MKFRAFSLMLIAAAALLPSCVTSGLATAAVVGSGVAGIPGVSSLIGHKAPEYTELVNHSFDYTGEYRGQDNVGVSKTGSILFAGADNPSVACLPDGSTRTTLYTRRDDKKAVITITTAAGVEMFRLTFTDGKQGTYTYEKRHGADFATGEGEFAIK